MESTLKYLKYNSDVHSQQKHSFPCNGHRDSRQTSHVGTKITHKTCATIVLMTRILVYSLSCNWITSVKKLIQFL